MIHTKKLQPWLYAFEGALLRFIIPSRTKTTFLPSSPISSNLLILGAYPFLATWSSPFVRLFSNHNATSSAPTFFYILILRVLKTYLESDCQNILCFSGSMRPFTLVPADAEIGHPAGPDELPGTAQDYRAIKAGGFSVSISDDSEFSTSSEDDIVQLGDVESNDGPEDRDNRFSGPQSTFKSWNAEAYKVMDSINTERAQDLSLHVFLSCALRLRLLKSGIRSLPGSQPSSRSTSVGTHTSQETFSRNTSRVSHSESECFQSGPDSDNEGRRGRYRKRRRRTTPLPRARSVDAAHGEWLPPQSWTAWPLHPSIVPGPEEQFPAGKNVGRGFNLPGPECLSPTEELSENIIAILERIARKQWRDRLINMEKNSRAFEREKSSIDGIDCSPRGSGQGRTDSSNGGTERQTRTNKEFEMPEIDTNSEQITTHLGLTVDEDLISRLFRPHAHSIMSDIHSLLISLADTRYPLSLIDKSDQEELGDGNDCCSSDSEESVGSNVASSESDWDDFLDQTNSSAHAKGSVHSDIGTDGSDSEHSDVVRLRRQQRKVKNGRTRQKSVRSRSRSAMSPKDQQAKSDVRPPSRASSICSRSFSRTITSESCRKSPYPPSSLRHHSSSESLQVPSRAAEEPYDWKVALQQASQLGFPPSVVQRASARLGSLFQETPPTAARTPSPSSRYSLRAWLGDTHSAVENLRNNCTGGVCNSAGRSDGFLATLARFRGRIMGEVDNWEDDQDHQQLRGRKRKRSGNHAQIDQIACLRDSLALSNDIEDRAANGDVQMGE